MIGIYTNTRYEPKEGEVLRKLSAYRSGETEPFASVVIIGDHANAELIASDYQALKIEVSNGVQAEEETSEKVKRTRKPKGEAE